MNFHSFSMENHENIKISTFRAWPSMEISYMVSSSYSESPTLTGVQATEKFYVVARNSMKDARYLLDFVPIVSVLENY